AKDPQNYMNYFRRAAYHLTLGRTSPALRDFTRVLELQPDHHQALMQRCKLLVKEGGFSDALDGLRRYRKLYPQDDEAEEMVSGIAAIKEAQSNVKEADNLAEAGKLFEAIEKLSKAVSVSGYDVDLRLKRAELYLQNGEKEMAIGDLSRAAKIKPDSAATLLQLSRLHLSLGEMPASVQNVKECLRVDPDHKECKRQFRAVKKLDKALTKADEDAEKGKWRDLIGKLVGEGALIGEVDTLGAKPLKKRVYDLACRAYSEVRIHNDNTLVWCTKTLELDSANIDALINRAEAKINKEEFEDAVRDYQKAHELDERNQRIIQGYNRAQRLLKQAGAKDYYKVLGVPRSASKREIKKAWRKLAQVWHPDVYRGDMPADAVEKKMGEINEAYEVLNNDELRARFDNGDDPNDQQNRNPFAQGGGHPFFAQGGGFPFGAGGHGGPQFQFKFNFQ
ncbi:hypothetical protein BDK51DRAFT_15330, partial [Blyttiomyces helicus]